jgi:hypothetical protein
MRKKTGRRRQGMIEVENKGEGSGQWGRRRKSDQVFCPKGEKKVGAQARYHLSKVVVKNNK